MRKLTIKQMRLLSASKMKDGRSMVKKRNTQTAGFKLLKDGRTLALKAEILTRKRRNRKNDRS